jgi:hypothetical protein
MDWVEGELVQARLQVHAHLVSGYSLIPDLS